MDKMRFQKFQFPYFSDLDDLKEAAAGFQPLGGSDDTPHVDPKEEEKERQFQAKLERAKEEAYAQGLEEGKNQGAETMKAELEPKHQQALEQAINDHQKAVASLVQTIATRMDNAAQEWTAQAKLSEQEVIHMAWALAQRIAGDALAEKPETSLFPALEEMLSAIQHGSTLTIKVAPDMVADVTDRLDELSERFQVGLNCIPDASLAPTDADILWEGGHASHRLEHLCERIQTALSVHPDLYTSPSPTRETETSAEPEITDTPNTNTEPNIEPTDEN